MANATAHQFSRITPAQLNEVLIQVENIAASMKSMADLYKIIGHQTTDFSVVLPLATSGKTIAESLQQDLYDVINRVAEMSVARIGVAA